MRTQTDRWAVSERQGSGATYDIIGLTDRRRHDRVVPVPEAESSLRSSQGDPSLSAGSGKVTYHWSTRAITRQRPLIATGQLPARLPWTVVPSVSQSHRPNRLTPLPAPDPHLYWVGRPYRGRELRNCLALRADTLRCAGPFLLHPLTRHSCHCTSSPTPASRPTTLSFPQRPTSTRFSQTKS